MSSPWIKVRTNLTNDPRVVQIAEDLNMDRYAVVGRLVAFWAWADEYSADGNGLTVTSSFLDHHLSCMGLGAALRKAGWLAGQEGDLSIPDFLKHNGQSCKARLLASERVKFSKAQKEKREVNGSTVNASLSLSTPDSSGVEVKEKGKAKDALMMRAEQLFHRRPDTAWDKSELKAWQGARAAVAATSDENWKLLVRWFALPQDKTFSRKGLAALLNHWNEEISRAQIYERDHPRSEFGWDEQTPKSAQA